MKHVTKLFLMFILLSSLLMLSGCFYTLNPIYTDKDVVFDPALTGDWVQVNGNRVLAFAQEGGENRYRLTYRDGAATQEYAVHLVELEGRRFLDFYPSPGGAPKSLSPVMPLHAIALVNQTGASLKLSFPNSQWMTRNIAPLGEDIVFTGTTEQTQQLLRRLLENQGEAFIALDFTRR